MTLFWKFYREDGSFEEVEVEAWRWVAHYTDGSVLKQFDNEGRFHQFREIDQSRLSAFSMENDTDLPITFLWRPGMKLIHFYRRGFRIGNIDISSNPELDRLYCFGYETATDKVISVILPDNSIVITDDVDNINEM